VIEAGDWMVELQSSFAFHMCLAPKLHFSFCFFILYKDSVTIGSRFRRRDDDHDKSNCKLEEDFATLLAKAPITLIT
jgi:hypothetical protein